MPWPQTGATQYHAQFGLPDSWDLEPAKRSGPLLLLTVRPLWYDS